MFKIRRGEEEKEGRDARLSSLTVRRAREVDLEATVALVRELAEELADRDGLDLSRMRERFLEDLPAPASSWPSSRGRRSASCIFAFSVHSSIGPLRAPSRSSSSPGAIVAAGLGGV